MEAMSETDGLVTARHERRAAELVMAGIAVLREEIAPEGSFARAIDRLERLTQAMVRSRSDAGAAAVHEALSHALLIGRAVYDTLEPRGRQCVETLAQAQQILYPTIPRSGPDAQPRPDERRASPRAAVDVAVTFESDDNFYQGFSEDISDGGLFIATYDLAPIGTRIELELTLPNGHIVCTSAEVRWIRDLRDECEGAPPGMGLAFCGLPPEDARAIAEFVEARAPIFYDD